VDIVTYFRQSPITTQTIARRRLDRVRVRFWWCARYWPKVQ
jgi:hypothetical protein